MFSLFVEKDLKSCDRLVLECDGDLLTHFDELAAQDALPALEALLGHARVLRERYATQAAYERSLDKSEQDDASATQRFPQGSTWTAPCTLEVPIIEPDVDAEMPGLTDIPDTPSAPATAEESSTAHKKPSNGPQLHQEPSGFDGDRVLSNSILFIREFGWWVEMNYAIPEGDVGRLLEMMKVIFILPACREPF